MRQKKRSNEFIKKCLSFALIDLMKTQDINTISISDICKKAGFGRTTYYRYFSNNKEELILFISNILWEECKAEHPDELKENEGMLLLRHIYNHKDFFLLLKKQDLIHLMFKMFYQEFGRHEDENEILSYGKSIFVGMYFAIVYEWVTQGCHDTPDIIEQKIKDGFLFALNEVSKKAQ